MTWASPGSSPVAWCFAVSASSFSCELGAERVDVVAGGYLHEAGCEVGAGAGADTETEVAASFRLFVVLLSQNSADEADQGVAAGDDADHVAPPLEALAFIAHVQESWRPGLQAQIGGLAGVVLGPRVPGSATSITASCSASSRDTGWPATSWPRSDGWPMIWWSSRPGG